MPLTRREFLLLGVTTGAAVGVGVVVPLTVAARDSLEDEVTATTQVSVDGPAALVTTFPRIRVAGLSSLQEAEPVFFDYPLEGQRNILVKLGEPALGGIGPDEDIVAFSRLCTHMGCTVEEYRPEHKVLGPCPCHFTTFDLVHNGMVVLGQATQNLPQVLLDTDGDDIYAAGLLRLVYGHADVLSGAPMVTGA